MVLKIRSGSYKSSATAKEKTESEEILSMSRMITFFQNKCHDMQKKNNFITNREYSDVSAWLPRKYCRAIVAYSFI